VNILKRINMPKKKLSTSKEKYDYLIKRYYSDIVTGVKTKENTT
jgi:hypothetical protein